MQLTLLRPLAPRAAVVCPVAQRGAGASSRDAVAISQLDRIAAANGARLQGAGLGGAATWLALLGGLVVLAAASIWQPDAPARKAEPRPQRALPRVATVTAPTTAAAPAALPTPDVAEAAPPPALTLAAAPPAVAAPPETVPNPVATPAAAPDAAAAARRARARQLEDARRKAQEQARVAADELQRQQQLQQREAERVAALANQARLASERAAREAEARSAAAAATPRSVREICSGAGFFSDQLCRTRACVRAEHQSDPICVQQREAVAAQLRASADR